MVGCGDSIITKIKCFCIFILLGGKHTQLKKWGNSKFLKMVYVYNYFLAIIYRLDIILFASLLVGQVYLSNEAIVNSIFSAFVLLLKCVLKKSEFLKLI